MHERLSFSQVAIVKSVLSTCNPSIVSLGRLQFAWALTAARECQQEVGPPCKKGPPSVRSQPRVRDTHMNPTTTPGSCGHKPRIAAFPKGLFYEFISGEGMTIEDFVRHAPSLGIEGVELYPWLPHRQ